MRFSTIFATAAIFYATGVAACRTDNDCPRGQMCKYLGIKDSQGKCYKRNEGPPTPSLFGKSHKKRAYVPRSYPIYVYEAREVADYDWE